MVDQRLKELRGPGRREFLRWSATVAACLGLERARFLNVLGDTAGTAAADTAACANTNRLISIVDGNGGLSNWTQIFPFAKVIGSTNAQYSHYALGKGVAATGYDKPYSYAPDSPWQTNSKWKMSAFVAGNNETHTAAPMSAISLGPNGMLASAAAIQQANPTLLPVLAVGGIQFGAAPGAPAVAAVGAANQLVDLFNSAASRALLQQPANGGLAEAYYKAFIGLNAAAGRTTIAKQYGVGKVSMNLLSKNLSEQLTPTAADQALLGLSGTSPGAVTQMGNAMITTVKAFSLGLTSMLVMRGFNNDPHGMFANGDAQAMATATAMGKMLTGIHDLAKSRPDPSCSAKTLADSIVMSFSGDTFKAPFARNGWGDGTPNGSNLLYDMGAGHLKSGWFGDMDPTAGAVGWDQTTGVASGTYNGRGAELGASAAAALLYAVSKGDARRVADFYNGKALGDGIVNLNVTG
ncbi:MAG: hypothetical protein JWO86_3643 [Myxococcaceae bacterium]|nr:hypothetical protein [Myxococcaceae bacterium]